MNTPQDFFCREIPTEFRDKLNRECGLNLVQGDTFRRALEKYGLHRAETSPEWAELMREYGIDV